MVSLDIISDPICPWCYIGKANLDAAIEETGVNPFEMNWRIFQLNPDMPPEGVDRREYLEWKFGGKERAGQIYDRIRDAAADSGLKVDFSKIERTPNTLDAHRLIRWAKTTGMQNALSQQLFVRYFEQGQDISDHTVLLDAAESVGMEREVVKSLLESDADKQMLLDEEATAREIGVSGVPCFIVGGKYVVQGAQPPETWVKVIRELVEAEAAQAKEQAGGVAGAQQP